MVQPESFNRIEDKFKLTLFQIEKRFVDLEMGISELKSKLKDVNMDAFTSMQQRVEDLEDLTMVENIGVIELKKMLEGIKTDFGGLPAAVAEVPKLTERLDKLETSVSEVSLKPESTELEQKVEKLKEEVAQLSAKPLEPPIDVEAFRTNIQNLKKDLDNLRMSFDQTVKTLDARIKGVIIAPPEHAGLDFEFMNSKLESLKTGIDLISDKKVETDLKIVGVEEKINILNNKIKEALSQKYIDELRLNKRDIMTTNLRIESIEKVIKELMTELNELNSTVKKFENFERLTILNKDVEEKLQRFQFLEDQTSKLSSRIEIIYDELHKRFVGLLNMQKDVERISRGLSDLSKAAEKNRIEIGMVKKEEIYKKLDNMQKRVSEMENLVISSKVPDLDNIKKGMEFFNKRVIEMSENMSRLNREVPQIIVDVGKLNEQKITAPKVGEAGDKINVLSQRMATIEGRIGNLYQMVKGVTVQEVKMDDKRFSQLFSQFSAMEDKMRELERKTAPPEDTEVVDEQMEELIGKLVFLESRMAAMERSVHETTTVSPVILE